MGACKLTLSAIGHNAYGADLLQVYCDGRWIGAVYREEPDGPWLACCTEADGTPPVRGTWSEPLDAARAIAQAKGAL